MRKPIACPHCRYRALLVDEVPPLPEALMFDCPACKLAFIVVEIDGEIRAFEATRTGQAKA